MYVQFRSVKEPSKNLDIWVSEFCLVLYGVGFGLGSCTFLLSGSVGFLAKPGFRFGSFLLGSVSFPSLEISTVLGSKWALLKLDVIFADALNRCLFKKYRYDC